MNWMRSSGPKADSHVGFDMPCSMICMTRPPTVLAVECRSGEWSLLAGCGKHGSESTFPVAGPDVCFWPRGADCDRCVSTHNGRSRSSWSPKFRVGTGCKTADFDGPRLSGVASDCLPNKASLNASVIIGLRASGRDTGRTYSRTSTSIYSVVRPHSEHAVSLTRAARRKACEQKRFIVFTDTIISQRIN